jgi:hypothetical protein
MCCSDVIKKGGKMEVRTIQKFKNLKFYFKNELFIGVLQGEVGVDKVKLINLLNPIQSQDLEFEDFNNDYTHKTNSNLDIIRIEEVGQSGLRFEGENTYQYKEENKILWEVQK